MLLAIPAGSAIAGALGMFVVVPAIGVVAATWRTVLSVMGSGQSMARPADGLSPSAEITEIVEIAEAAPV